jgi:hypothetical protein
MDREHTSARRREGKVTSAYKPVLPSPGEMDKLMEATQSKQATGDVTRIDRN